MKMVWVAVGDSNTCPDCMERHGETHTEEEWQQTYGEPRSVLADTACGRRCRCVLAPAVVEAEMSREEKRALDAAIDEAAGKMTGGIDFDLRRGGPTILKDHGHAGLSSMPYAEVARVEEKIGRWKIANDYAPLPPEVWSGDLDQMEAWLDEALKWFP